jgi:hypothetical protein
MAIFHITLWKNAVLAYFFVLLSEKALKRQFFILFYGKMSFQLRMAPKLIYPKSEIRNFSEINS